MMLDKEQIAAALPGYDIGGEIGHGAWGVVVRATQRQLRREVAIKRLPRAFAADPSVRHRFVTEARLLATLDHPHIVPIYDYVEEEGLCLLVMELLPGGTVGERFTTSGLTMQAACSVALATAGALGFAHDHGILHRDVKPENLLLTASDIVKVSDFGIAKIAHGNASMVTLKGQVLGTPAYISPEQAMGQALTAATDLYALGTVLFELLSGRLPFDDDGDPLALMYRHVNENPARLASVAPDIPFGLCDVVMKCLAKDPVERYQSAEDLGIAIADATTAVWGPRWHARTGLPIMASEAVAAHLSTPQTDAVPKQGSQPTIRVTSTPARVVPLASVGNSEIVIEPAADGADRWTAWAGVEIISAVNLSEVTTFAGLDDTQRLELAIDEQVVWLSGMLDPAAATDFELRWSTVASQRRLCLHLLLRCTGPSEGDARRCAAHASERLRQLPRHVVPGPPLARDDLLRILTPFRPHLQGLVEIRKQTVFATPNRPDARVSFYVAVRPLSTAARPWTQLLAALAAYPHPLILTIGLRPVAISPSFTNNLLEIAANYTRLASPGEWKPPGMLYRQGSLLTADPFAVEAERLYRDAARRYAGLAFRSRILLASPEPITDGLAAVAGATISPAARADTAHRTGNPIGDAFELGRPSTDAERSVVVWNLTRLEHHDWGGDSHFWGEHGLIPPTVRSLRRLVDPREAASAFRLPIASDGALPGFLVSSVHR